MAPPLNFLAVMFAACTFQKINLSSGMLRIERERIQAEIDQRADDSAPTSLILPTTHRHFANYHFRLPAGHDRKIWRPAFHLSDPHLAGDAEHQYAQVTPLFVLSTIDLRIPRLSDVLEKLMSEQADRRTDISIRELLSAYDSHAKRKARS